MIRNRPKPEHVAFMNDLKAALGRHPDLTADEYLALASQFVGNLIAIQDQRKMTPSQAMELVRLNLVEGNLAALATLDDTKGTA